MCHILEEVKLGDSRTDSDGDSDVNFRASESCRIVNHPESLKQLQSHFNDSFHLVSLLICLDLDLFMN